MSGIGVRLNSGEELDIENAIIVYVVGSVLVAEGIVDRSPEYRVVVASHKETHLF